MKLVYFRRTSNYTKSTLLFCFPLPYLTVTLTRSHPSYFAVEMVFMVRLADAGDLTLRIYAMVDCPPMNGYCRDQVPRLENYANGFLSVRSVKLFADGALGSWGAAMIEDYEDKPGNRGSMLLEYERLEELVRKVHIPLPS